MLSLSSSAFKPLTIRQKILIITLVGVIPLALFFIHEFLYYRRGWHSPEIQFTAILWLVRILLVPGALLITTRYCVDLDRTIFWIAQQSIALILFIAFHWLLCFSIITLLFDIPDVRYWHVFTSIRQSALIDNVLFYSLAQLALQAWTYLEQYRLALISNTKIKELPEQLEQPEELFIQKLAIKTGSRSIILAIDQITCISANGAYVKVHTTDGKNFLYHQPLYKFQENLPVNFMRIHRSCIVNSNHIIKTQSLLNGDYRLTLSSGLEVKASRTYRDNLRLILGKF